MSRNSTGVISTSISCSGTCLILSIPRQPNVSAADTRPAWGGRAPDASAACRRSSVVRGSVFVIGFLRHVAGQREEYLVEAGLGEREAREADAGLVQRRDRGRRLVGVSDRKRERGGVGLFMRVAAEDDGGRVALPGIQQADVQRTLPDARLQLRGRALGDHLPVIDNRDPVGELVGLVEVLRAQQDGGAFADE